MPSHDTLSSSHVRRDVVHLFHFSPAAYSVRNENGPRGDAIPNWPLSHRPVPDGIPAPRCSRRETPIKPAKRYLGAMICVKAILPLLTTEAGGWRSGVGGNPGAARGTTRGEEAWKANKVAAFYTGRRRALRRASYAGRSSFTATAVGFLPLVGCIRLRSGYRSGCSRESTARSMSRSGQ